MRCEGPGCTKRGKHRADYDAYLCDTHAEVPSFDLPKASRLAQLGDGLVLCVALPWLAFLALANRRYAQPQA